MAAVLRTAARMTAKAQYSEDYALANERVKTLISHFEAWLKCVKKYLNALEALNVASGTSINHALEWSDACASITPTFASIVKTVETVNQKLQTERNNVKWRYTKDLVEPLETFLATDLSTARKLKEEFRAIQLQLQSAERTLNDLKASTSKAAPRNPADNLDKELAYWERFKEMERRFLLSDNAIKDALFKKEFLVPELFGALLDAESVIAQTSAAEFAAFQDRLNRTEEQSTAKARDEGEQAAARDVEARESRLARYDARWHELVRMISSPDLILVQSICSTAGSKSDHLLESIIRILDAHHETLPLIRVGIQREAESTTSEGSLFRGNSTATKLMSAFTRLTGRPYLQSTLKTLLHDVQTDPNGYEVDPSKVKGGESVESNMAKLLATSARFLDTILGSLDNCPLAFRYLARVLRTEVCQKFPDARYSSVGGFLFLRFFCPAILAPESCGLALSGVPDAKARRPLILIGKVLQNLSNNVRFGGKEAFMAPVNQFIDENLPRLNEFFDVVVDVDEEAASDYPPLTNLDEVEQHNLPEIFQILTENLEAVVKSLISWKNEEAIPGLIQVLAQLRVNIEQGPPSAQLSFLPNLPTKLSAPYLNPGFDFAAACPSPSDSASSSFSSSSSLSSSSLSAPSPFSFSSSSSSSSSIASQSSSSSASSPSMHARVASSSPSAPSSSSGFETPPPRPPSMHHRSGSASSSSSSSSASVAAALAAESPPELKQRPRAPVRNSSVSHLYSSNRLSVGLRAPPPVLPRTPPEDAVHRAAAPGRSQMSVSFQGRLPSEEAAYAPDSALPPLPPRPRGAPASPGSSPGPVPVRGIRPPARPPPGRASPGRAAPALPPR